jgi:hypothetical protein
VQRRHRFLKASLFIVTALYAGFASAQDKKEVSRFLTPPATQLEATDSSSASDLSALNVDFKQGPGALASLKELLPDAGTTATVADGWLRVRGVKDKMGWYSDRSGPMFYKEVSGDFMVETRARSIMAADPAKRPTGNFNSSGLLVRDAASTPKNMRWLMYNFGQQDKFYGTEAKNTIPDFGGFHMHKMAGFSSRSTLWLTPMADAIIEAELRICRVGAEFRFFKKPAGASDWTEEAYSEGTTTQGNGAGKPTQGVTERGTIRFIRPDLPATVQVGLISNPGMGASDGESWFDGIRFQRITSFEQCAH